MLSNILLDKLDKELERRGHRFCRYADDGNIYVRTKAAGERVMGSLTGFLWERIRLRVNREKSGVGRRWERKSLGYTTTWHRRPKLRVAPSAIRRMKAHIQEMVGKGRGRSLSKVIGEMTVYLQGWANDFRLAQIKNVFEELDQRIRRKLRSILWRQWKRPITRAKKLILLRLDKERAYTSAYNVRGDGGIPGRRP